MANEKLRLMIERRFEASHMLTRHPGKCRRLHGHSWRLQVWVDGPIQEESGFVLDYAYLKQVVDTVVIDILDHRHLGHGNATFVHLEDQAWSTTGAPLEAEAALGPDFYPSAENLVLWIARRLSEALPSIVGIDTTSPQLLAVALDETCTSRAMWVRPGEEFYG